MSTTRTKRRNARRVKKECSQQWLRTLLTKMLRTRWSSKTCMMSRKKGLRTESMKTRVWAKLKKKIQIILEKWGRILVQAIVRIEGILRCQITKSTRVAETWVISLMVKIEGATCCNTTIKMVCKAKIRVSLLWARTPAKGIQTSCRQRIVMAMAKDKVKAIATLTHLCHWVNFRFQHSNSRIMSKVISIILIVKIVLLKRIKN